MIKNELTKNRIMKELKEFIEINETMKRAANMVGFDVEAETKRFLDSADNRVKINIWQTDVIKTLKMLLE